MEWPLKVAYNNNFRMKEFYPCPKDSILPIKFISRDEVILENYDKIMDLCQDGVFYDNSPSLYTMDNQNIVHHNFIGFLSYINKYFIDKKEHPTFNIPKEKTDKPYILFHLRIGNWSEYRNPSLIAYKDMVSIISKGYKNKFELNKIGEEQRVIDRNFNNIYTYHTNFNEFLKLINNSSLFVGCEAGPSQYARMLGIPIICIEGNANEDINGKVGYFHKDFWKKHFKGQYGETGLDWMDSNKELRYVKGQLFNEKEINGFIDKCTMNS